MKALELLGTTLGIGFVAGINLYATVLTLGLGLRFELLHLPPHLAGLSILAHHAVLGAAAIAYIAEFFADKIPWVDSLWDSFHLFIRPFGAALLVFSALGTLDPAAQAAIVILCGSAALSTHSAKAGVRLIANHSPEPFTNVGLSLAEDALAIGGAWLALAHPMTTLFLVVVALSVLMFLMPKLLRLIRIQLLAVLALLRRARKGSANAEMMDPLPDRYLSHFGGNAPSVDSAFVVRCVSGKGMSVGRNRVGFLYLHGNRLCFLTRGLFRFRYQELDVSGIDHIIVQRTLLFDRVRIQSGDIYLLVYLFKHPTDRGTRIARLLEATRAQPVTS